MAKKNLFTWITYCIAACVILACTAAVIISIIGNKDSAAPSPQTDNIISSGNNHTESGKKNEGISPDDAGLNGSEPDKNDSIETKPDENVEVPFSLFE